MTRLFVCGVDPGETSGVVALSYLDGVLLTAQAFQCNAASTEWLVLALLDNTEGWAEDVVLAVERFVVGPRAARSRTAKAGATTRDLVGRLTAPDAGWRTVARSASEVKPWSSDERLEAATLLAPTKEMRHARDAARHALFAAVADGGIPDPLSRAARR